MIVDDLRAALADLPGDLPVILPADAEGNGCTPAAGVNIAYYSATTEWEGRRHHPDDELPGDAREALFIEPAN